ncbi:hypothetical protein COLO4_35438 [Corchorus olitorius]|uniref:Uncharacterized protein n=1 Tax=Corchorus olitorius TaxID=93759 RepID=A0A1R3GGX3_9ROSI|nr:hypothetical protein COLO4_35438 [Corchorus olitorius]
MASNLFLVVFTHLKKFQSSTNAISSSCILAVHFISFFFFDSRLYCWILQVLAPPQLVGRLEQGLHQ